MFLQSVQVLKLGGSLVIPALQSGQILGSGKGVLSTSTDTDWSGFDLTEDLLARLSDSDIFVSCFCVVGCFMSPVFVVCGTAGLFRDVGGVELWETVEALREVGGVVDVSSCTAEDIKLDAELRKEDPKPRTFPETADTAG